MARDRDSDGLGGNQSKRPASANFDLADQPQQQHPPQQHHRVKSQKHIVGGATGGRLHARIPSSKGLKHHGATSTAKLNRRQGSLSPDRGAAAALVSHHHRRATSDLKLTRDSSSTNLKKKTKSSTSLHRAASNQAINKLKNSGHSRVQFNLGDEQNDDQDDDEWVDASTSASPLLSRRGSAVSGGQANAPVDDESSSAASPTPLRDEFRPTNGTQNKPPNGAANIAQDGGRSLPRNNKSSHNKYLTSRILSRTPSQGAPPMMSAETVQVRPASRQNSPHDPTLSAGQSLSGTPRTAPQVRPGSSGKAELTSRFVGNNSQEAGSGIAGESFILAAHRGSVSRAALNGTTGLSLPKRRQSAGALSQARGIDALKARQAATEDNLSDGEDEDEPSRAPRSRRNGDYAIPRDLNRTQQKLNLQRASSTLEPAHPHPGIGIIPAGLLPAGMLSNTTPLMGGVLPSTYHHHHHNPNSDTSRDPRINKLLERTGMEYLTVRRHLNPVARSIARVMQLPDLENSRRIPRSGTTTSTATNTSANTSHNRHHSANKLSEQLTTTTNNVTRNSSMADLITTGRRPPTPRRAGRGGGADGPTFTLGGGGAPSTSSSLGTDDGGAAAAGRMMGRGGGGGGNAAAAAGVQGLSGTSLVDGAEDAHTVALLRMMWDKNALGASGQD
ncbi:hypothetical protein N0V88_005448 [Collariella sp. IMI 366227]|nr:hypothetical protein N0V88_005448 [Collariella sp. IMI 366227]